MDDKARDSHSILARWGNLFSQMLNVYWVNDIKQTEIIFAISIPE
jgi:hypothetical protein